MSKYHAQKHSNLQIIKVIGQLIAEGSTMARRLPRLKADEFKGRIVIQGSAYMVSMRWPDGGYDFDQSVDVRPLGETDDRDSTDIRSIKGF